MSRGRSNVEVDDRRYRRVMRELRRANAADLSAHVGIIGTEAAEQHPDSPDTIAQIAARHELGAGVRRRSWLRDWVTQNRPDIQRRLARIIDECYLGINRGTAMVSEYRRQLDILGQWSAGQIKARIARGITPPNAQSTIDRKGSGKPLIDTGAMLNSITSEVRKG